MMNLEWAKARHEEVTASCKTPNVEFKYGDECVHVYNRLLYERIKAAAEEYASLLIYEDPETGRNYMLPYQNILWNYIALKYFTDFDVEGCSTTEDFVALYDVAEAIDLAAFIDANCEGAYRVKALGERIAESAVKMNNDAKSVMTKISKWMEDMPVNEDWAKELARSKEINDTMINLIGDQKEKQGEKVLGRGKVVDLTSFAKRK